MADHGAAAGLRERSPQLFWPFPKYGRSVYCWAVKAFSLLQSVYILVPLICIPQCSPTMPMKSTWLEHMLKNLKELGRRWDWLNKVTRTGEWSEIKLGRPKFAWAFSPWWIQISLTITRSSLQHVVLFVQVKKDPEEFVSVRPEEILLNQASI